jgi:hypothetical protein
MGTFYEHPVHLLDGDPCGPVRNSRDALWTSPTYWWSVRGAEGEQYAAKIGPLPVDGSSQRGEIMTRHPRAHRIEAPLEAASGTLAVEKLAAKDTDGATSLLSSNPMFVRIQRNAMIPEADPEN